MIPEAFVGTMGAAAGDPVLTGWQVVSRLLAVLLLVVVVAFALRHWAGPRGRGSGRRAGMQVVDALPLGPQRALYVVKVGRRGVVLGVTPHTVQFLLELTPEELEAMSPPKDSSAAGKKSFRDLFHSHWDKPRPPDGGGGPTPEG